MGKKSDLVQRCTEILRNVKYQPVAIQKVRDTVILESITVVSSQYDCPFSNRVNNYECDFFYDD